MFTNPTIRAVWVGAFVAIAILLAFVAGGIKNPTRVDFPFGGGISGNPSPAGATPSVQPLPTPSNSPSPQSPSPTTESVERSAEEFVRDYFEILDKGDIDEAWSKLDDFRIYRQGWPECRVMPKQMYYSIYDRPNIDIDVRDIEAVQQDDDQVIVEVSLDFFGEPQQSELLLVRHSSTSEWKITAQGECTAP